MRVFFVVQKANDINISGDYRGVEIKQLTNPKKRPKYKWLFVVFLLALAVGYIVYDPQGKPELSPKRKAKLDSAIKYLYEQDKQPCEQYVLRARYSAWFPILKYGEKTATDSIWLNKDEVWRYGKTCVNEEGRYPGGIYYVDAKWKLTKDHLLYLVQFTGSEVECLVEEKRKIFNYPLLPECLTRIVKLKRPAGNKNDN